MNIIALFFPALISVAVRHNRNEVKDQGIIGFVLEYGIDVLVNTLSTQIIITYLLKMNGVEMSAFFSFPFFTKYVVIAVIMAFIWPYIQEIVKKTIHVSLMIEEKNEENKE